MQPAQDHQGCPLPGRTNSYPSMTLAHRTSNVDDQARLDISAKGFWNNSHELAFFDERVFNPLAKSHVNQSLSSCYRKHENEKKRHYEERVCNIECGTFTPLVFSAAGGMGPTATTFYKRLAFLFSERLHKSYNQTICCLRPPEFFFAKINHYVSKRGKISLTWPDRFLPFMFPPT